MSVLRPAAFALISLAAPALAQDDPIFAPCLQQFPAPEEFGDASGYIAAMQDAGWTHLTQAPDREPAAPGLAEISAAVIFFPSAFETVDSALDFVTRAGRSYRQAFQFNEVFSRDGVSAAVSAAQLSPGAITVECIFAGSSLVGMDDLLAQAADSPFGDLAVELVAVDVEEPEKTIRLNVTAVRFVEDEAVLAPLSVREGISLSYAYEPAP